MSNSVGFLLAGYDTTGNALSYTSYLLAVNPSVQEKLQAEIDSFFEQNPVSSSMRHNNLLYNGVNCEKSFTMKWFALYSPGCFSA